MLLPARRRSPCKIDISLLLSLHSQMYVLYASLGAPCHELCVLHISVLHIYIAWYWHVFVSSWTTPLYRGNHAVKYVLLQVFLNSI